MTQIDAATVSHQIGSLEGQVHEYKDTSTKNDERIEKAVAINTAAIGTLQIQQAKFQTWFVVLGFLGSIIVPSLWAIIFAALLNNDVLSKLAAVLPTAS